MTMGIESRLYCSSMIKQKFIFIATVGTSLLLSRTAEPNWEADSAGRDAQS